MTTSAELYRERFDPDVYYSVYFEYLFQEDTAADKRQRSRTFRHFQLARNYNFYSTLESEAASDKRLHILEFGGGPTIAALISAAPYAEKMVFSDFVGRNREFVDMWRNHKSPGPDFRKLIQYVVQSVEGNKHDEAERREQELRDKLVSVVHCDIRQDPPVQDTEEAMYDVVSTHLCLAAACESVDTYREGLRKLAALVRPGGSIVGSDTLGGTFYTVGDVRFPELFLTRDDISQALLDAGFRGDVSFSSLPMEGSSGDYDAKEYVVYTAKKTSSL